MVNHKIEIVFDRSAQSVTLEKHMLHRGAKAVISLADVLQADADPKHSQRSDNRLHSRYTYCLCLIPGRRRVTPRAHVSRLHGKQTSSGDHPKNQRLVTAHKQLEARFDCEIDTSRRTLPSSLLGKLKNIDLLPTLYDVELSCVGYIGGPITMTGGIEQHSHPSGRIIAGDTVPFRFERWGGFEFVETDASAGWMPEDSITVESCEVFAG